MHVVVRGGSSGVQCTAEQWRSQLQVQLQLQYLTQLVIVLVDALNGLQMNGPHQ